MIKIKKSTLGIFASIAAMALTSCGKKKDVVFWSSFGAKYTGILNNIVDDKVQKLESNPMLETNFSIQQQWKFSENEVVKKRQTFVKNID